jgi:hypothetical protein
MPMTIAPIIVVLIDPRAKALDERAAKSKYHAGHLARGLLITMWRRPGASLEIREGDRVLWIWAGWRTSDPARLTFNQWRLAAGSVEL